MRGVNGSQSEPCNADDRSHCESSSEGPSMSARWRARIRQSICSRSVTARAGSRARGSDASIFTARKPSSLLFSCRENRLAHSSRMWTCGPVDSVRRDGQARARAHAADADAIRPTLGKNRAAQLRRIPELSGRGKRPRPRSLESVAANTPA